MKKNSLLMLIFILGVNFTVFAALNEVFHDALDGSTVGTRQGGSFTGGGWKVTDATDQIAFDIGHFITGPGAVEVQVTNWDPMNQVGTVAKSEFLSIWEGPHGDWRQMTDSESYVRYRSGANYVPKGNLKADLRAGESHYQEKQFPMPVWESKKTYTFRIEWDTDSIYFQLDGVTKKQFEFGSLVDEYKLRYIFIGRNNCGINGGIAVPGPVYKNVRVFEEGGMTPIHSPLLIRQKSPVLGPRESIINLDQRATISFDFRLPGGETLQSGHVGIYDEKGTRIREIKTQNPQARRISWDLTDDNTHRLKAGLYLYDLNILGDNNIINKKGVIVILK